MASNQSDNRSVPVHARSGKSLPKNFSVGERFNPYQIFTGIFIPESICKYRGISLGAKMVYGRLCRYAGENGKVFPSVPTLGGELGIGKTQARTYLQELERSQFIEIDRKDRHFRADGTGGSNTYVFLWHAAFSGELGEKRKSPPVRKTGYPPVRKTGGVPIRKTGHEESHHQESQEKESQFPAPAAFPISASTVPTPKPTSKALFLRSDDDEKPTPKPLSVKEELPVRAPLSNPEMEFNARITERHGSTVDAGMLIQDIRKELNGVPLAEYLEADTKATTAPQNLKNPAGHYRTLARKIGNRKTTAALESVIQTQQQAREFLKQGAATTPFKPTCSLCHEGVLREGVGYCSCKVGDTRRQIAERFQHQASSEKAVGKQVAA